MAEEIINPAEQPEAQEPVVKETRKFSNASVAPEEFDWDAFENEASIYGESDKTAIEAAYDQTLSKVVENDVVEGTVTGINKREVIVNIGYKSEGVIPAPEFRYNPELKVGDKVEVYVESAEDRKGQLILSHKKARQLRSWDMVNAAYDNQDVVKGFIKTR
ncbi:MAG: S1 RNA-binding domain-containing protein, partial [Bacteroidales bacterium]|nr:S1 RNA-binding domain-containing protein [Bacteroidales bacterium]